MLHIKRKKKRDTFATMTTDGVIGDGLIHMDMGFYINCKKANIANDYEFYDLFEAKVSDLFDEMLRSNQSKAIHD